MIMKKPLRIAILETGTPRASVVVERGSYGDMFTRLFNEAADSLNYGRENLAISCWDVVNKEQEYPSISEIDAILITGSSVSCFILTNYWVV